MPGRTITGLRAAVVCIARAGASGVPPQPRPTDGRDDHRQTACLVHRGGQFFHMVVAGNNVKLKAHGRVPVEEHLIEDYAAIRRDFHNSELIAGLILAALLRNRPWFAELDAPIHDREWSYFVPSTQERRRTPTAMIGFAWEVNLKFKSLFPPSSAATTRRAPRWGHANASPERVDAIIYDLVRNYVRERACAPRLGSSSDENWWTKAADERRDVCIKTLSRVPFAPTSSWATSPIHLPRSPNGWARAGSCGLARAVDITRTTTVPTARTPRRCQTLTMLAAAARAGLRAGPRSL